MLYQYTKLGCQWFSSSEDMERSFLWGPDPSLWPPSRWQQLMKVYQHDMFCWKRFTVQRLRGSKQNANRRVCKDESCKPPSPLTFIILGIKITINIKFYERSVCITYSNNKQVYLHTHMKKRRGWGGGGGKITRIPINNVKQNVGFKIYSSNLFKAELLPTCIQHPFGTSSIFRFICKLLLFSISVHLCVNVYLTRPDITIMVHWA